jgi:hypothetical protein
MIQTVTDYPDSLPALRRLAGQNMALELIYCTDAPRKEAAQMIQDILNADPQLGKASDDQKRELFKLWANDTSSSLVAQRILGNPAWLPVGWPVVTEYLASVRDYRRAYEIAHEFAPAPPSPADEQTASPRAALAARFYADPSDYGAGVALCRQYMESGQAEDALVQSEKMTAREDCPPYIFALQASYFAARQEWRQAFESLKKSSSLPQ